MSVIPNLEIQNSNMKGSGGNYMKKLTPGWILIEDEFFGIVTLVVKTARILIKWHGYCQK